MRRAQCAAWDPSQAGAPDAAAEVPLKFALRTSCGGRGGLLRVGRVCALWGAASGPKRRGRKSAAFRAVGEVFIFAEKGFAPQNVDVPSIHASPTARRLPSPAWLGNAGGAPFRGGARRGRGAGPAG